MSIVTFEHDVLGSVSNELRTLGPAFSLAILAHCQRVQMRKSDYRKHKVFTTFQGVEMFDASIGQQCIVYSVESDPMDDLKISIMFAGERGKPVTVASYHWDGHDDAQLCDGILQARSAVWFI